MKRMGLGLSLSFIALSLLVSPALAASSPQAVKVLRAADQAFLASLAASTRAPASAPAARHPRRGGSGTIQGKALCTASATCWDGSTVSCEGNNSSASCSAVDSQCPWGEQGHVTCDGATTWCPSCPFNCSQAEDNCYRWCYPCSFSFSCDESGPSCDCNWSTCSP